jgi:hypothetical protein
MRSDRPLIVSVIFLGAGLGLILGYCHGTTSFNAAYPLAGSSLHLDLTTTGPAVLGGMVCTAIGCIMLIWAFLAGLVSLFTWKESTSERVVERYTTIETADGTSHAEAPDSEIAEHKHFWSRPARTRI